MLGIFWQWSQRVNINFLIDPYFWAFVSMASLFFWVVYSGLRAGRHRLAFDLMTIAVFAGAQLTLVLPSTDGERLGWGAWRLVLGVALLLLALTQLITALLYTHALFNPARQTAYTRLLRRTGGIYSMIRYPFFLAGLFFTSGAAITFNSLIGLLLQPVWWAAFLLLIRVEARQLKRDLGGYFKRYEQRMLSYLLPWKAMLDLAELPAYPFKNLVFKGGGACGMAYIGAMQALEEKGILPQIECVAGTSAGALVAAFAAMGIHHSQWAGLLKDCDIDSIMNRHGSKFKLRNLARLESNFGLFSTDGVYHWLRGLIARHCDGKELATFADFRQKGFLDLAVVASNLSRLDSQVFSFRDSPDTPVADAVIMSIAIPLYFNVLRHDGLRFGTGDYYVDGGLFNNYPIQLFDAPTYSRDNPWYLGGINYQTLGFYLIPDPQTQPVRGEIKNFIDYLFVLFDNLAHAHSVQPLNISQVDQRRSVMISDCGISMVDFSAVLHTQAHDCLLRSGHQSTLEFLQNFQLPMQPDPALPASAKAKSPDMGFARHRKRSSSP